jgi:hypothetical protein
MEDAARNLAADLKQHGDAIAKLAAEVQRVPRRDQQQRRAEDLPSSADRLGDRLAQIESQLALLLRSQGTQSKALGAILDLLAEMREPD